MPYDQWFIGGRGTINDLRRFDGELDAEGYDGADRPQADNASVIQNLTEARSKAHAISIALSLTRYVIDQVVDGADFLLRADDGQLKQIIMAELQNARRRQSHARSQG